VAVLVSLEGSAESDRALARRLTAEARALVAALDLKRRELSLLLTDDAHIRELNRHWRDEDKATDVLSFPMDEPGGDPSKELGPLGDIALSLETAARDAEAIGWARDDLASFLLVHAFCHLLGHDHGEPEEAAAMKLEEDRLFAITRPGLARPPTPY
jgi:probable rRNA maturation factor